MASPVARQVIKVKGVSFWTNLFKDTGKFINCSPGTNFPGSKKNIPFYPVSHRASRYATVFTDLSLSIAIITNAQ